MFNVRTLYYNNINILNDSDTIAKEANILTKGYDEETRGVVSTYEYRGHIYHVYENNSVLPILAQHAIKQAKIDKLIEKEKEVEVEF